MQVRHFRNILRLAISLMGLESHLCDTHSFHIGCASDLNKMGANLEKIKHVGRWKSNAVYKYIKSVLIL